MKKILFVNTEIIPYVPETQMAVSGKMVPSAMLDKGCEIRTFMPKWGNINERRGQLHEVIRLSGLNIIIADNDHPTLIKVASIPGTKIQVYFIDNEDFFFKRKMECDDAGTPYADNGKRAIFFARAVIETIKKLRWTPDIIHCQGWMASLVPFYMKKAYADEPSVSNAKVVTSVFGADTYAPLADVDMKNNMLFKDITTDMLEDYPDTFTGKELARLAVEYSDGVIDAQPEIPSDIAKVIEAEGIRHLVYPGDDFGEAYVDFYDSLFS